MACLPQSLYALGLLLCTTLCQAQQDPFDQLVYKRLSDDRIPGLTMAVLKNGKLIKQGAYGMANLELQVPVSLDSVFALASLTKQFTAAAVVTLVEQKKLSLQAPLGKLLDDLPEAWQPITVHQLLTHRAGLTHRFERTIDGRFMLDYSREQMLTSAKQTALQAEPGTDWSYSDQGYFLLGLIIEKISGMSYGEFLQRHFFAPLQMQQTRMLEQAAIIPKRVAGYRVEDGQWVNDRRVWQFALTSHFGVMSSIEDMIKWEKALNSDQLLTHQVKNLLWQPQYVFQQQDDNVIAYGYGWWVRKTADFHIVEHSGFTGTSYFRELNTGVSVIVLTNRDQPSGPGTIEIAHDLALLAEPRLASALARH